MYGWTSPRVPIVRHVILIGPGAFWWRSIADRAESPVVLERRNSGSGGAFRTGWEWATSLNERDNELDSPAALRDVSWPEAEAERRPKRSKTFINMLMRVVPPAQ
jgi:hypothetical protein